MLQTGSRCDFVNDMSEDKRDMILFLTVLPPTLAGIMFYVFYTQSATLKSGRNYSVPVL